MIYNPAQQAETWQRIAEASEAAAKRELLKNSADLAELEKLELAAKVAQEQANAKSRELQAAFSEFNSIPEKSEAINVRLTYPRSRAKILPE